MTHQHFLTAWDEELIRRRAHFQQKDLHKYVELHWAAMTKDPDVARWARDFLDAGHGSVSV